MANRIEVLRKTIDEILLQMTDVEERRCAYIHLYGVAQSCALIALKRNADVELATMAGMLHDIYTYAKMDSNDHAHKGAILAKEILEKLPITNKEETKIICQAIYNHSEKAQIHDLMDEILIDADVMQHCLYNPLFEVKEHEKERYKKLMREFSIELLRI